VAQDTRATDIGIDVSDPQLYQGDPFPAFARLRRKAPVYANPSELPFWALTRYDDVIHVSKHPEIFCSEEGAILHTPPEGSMLSMDDPRHRQLRRLVEKGFTPRMVRNLHDYVGELARNIVDEIAPRGECDFVEDVAAELPLAVIAELIGTPRSDAGYLKHLGDVMIGHADPEFNPDGSEERAASAQTEMFGYFQNMARERRDDPRDDLISILLNADIDGEKLEEMDFLIFCMLLVVAGNETTRNLIAGGQLLLLENPDACAQLRADPSRLPGAVEEMLRMVTPVMQFQRTVTRDTEIRGVPIAEGEKVVIYYIAANRDEDVFADPERFDITRDPNPHLTFGGGGPHFCLGASLARLEIRTIFEELLQRIPDMEPAGEVERLYSNFIRGIKRMPVRFSPTR
jgi:cholest-4-en-3-one 26-monooxygenase